MEGPPLRRILIVEDDPDIRELLTYALTELSSYQVLACERGDQAVLAAVEFRPDVVLLDSMLPGMDGTSVLRALRAQAPTAEVPVIFLTARTMPTDLAEYRLAGAARVIPKPFEIDAVKGELEKAWAEHRHVVV